MTSDPHADLTAAIAQLRQFDTPTVLNVIELFDVRPHHHGYVNGSVRALFPELPPMVGFAFTATYTATSQGEGITLGEMVEAFPAVPEPRVIVYQSLESPPAAAIFGDISCAFFKKLGCAGLVTDGAGRDLALIRPMAFPCFASSVIASHGYARATALNLPVSVGGQEIRPGDLLHGDANGVAVVPLDIAAEVARACGPMQRAEAALLGKINAPSATIVDASRAHREFLAEVAEVRRAIGRHG
jgi:4-hydroxy-4-methyl-2-oxoglutarate aldolase